MFDDDSYADNYDINDDVDDDNNNVELTMLADLLYGELKQNSLIKTKQTKNSLNIFVVIAVIIIVDRLLQQESASLYPLHLTVT